MLRNITLNADDQLIDAARAQAQARHTTLNREFRRWLTQYTQRQSKADNVDSLMTELRGQVRMGRTFTRDELNER